MKRVFGMVEATFDILYLVVALILSIILLLNETDNTVKILAGIMGLILVIGDSFHLIPRIIVIMTRREEQFRMILGRGKQITSITMTIFYLLLWKIGLQVFNLNNIDFWSYIVYLLATIRIFLCLLPQNKWIERYPPVKLGICRNIPFFLQGMVVSGLYFLQRNINSRLSLMWLAILLSFLFYLPVVLWSNKKPKIGMLMLPKTCAYVWMLIMCLSL